MKGISVIIPVYNRESFISTAISSVLMQNYDGNLEIIISDDGSTDKTLEIAKSFLYKNSQENISIIILNKPEDCKTQGVSSTRNRALRIATHEYISFLDSDDYYLPNHLNKAVKFLENNEYLSFVFCRIIEERTLKDRKYYRPFTKLKPTKNDIKNIVVVGSSIEHTISFVFKCKIFCSVGNFNENYTNGEDGDLWMRISERFAGGFLNYYGAVYRTFHSSNQLTNNCNEIKRLQSMIIFKEAINRYFSLGLHDKYRLFALRFILLFLTYPTKPMLYYYKYFLLWFQFPKQAFIRLFSKLIRIYYKKSQYRWRDLEEIIK